MGEEVDVLVRKLVEEGAAVQARLTALAPETWERTVYAGNETWTGRAVLAHMITAEQGHQRLIADVVRGGPGAPPDFDVDAFNRSKVAELAGRPVAQLLDDWRSVRTGTVALVSGLSDDDLAKRGGHPALGEGAALADFVRIVFVHARIHLRDIVRATAR